MSRVLPGWTTTEVQGTPLDLISVTVLAECLVRLSTPGRLWSECAPAVLQHDHSEGHTTIRSEFTEPGELVTG